MSYTYLLVVFFTILVPFIFSFHPRLNFHKTWKAFFPAVIITGIFFIMWDIYFTNLGVWGFNYRYLTGITIINLPLEELLFFFCIPYACVFTFHCLNIFIKNTFPEKIENTFTFLFIIILTFSGLLNYEKAYTAFAFLTLSLMLIFTKYVLKVKWLAKFYLIYAILLLPFLVVNGILTGTGLEQPVVWYNKAEITGIRILTIPMEDIFYGMGLILMNVLIYLHLLGRSIVKEAVAHS